MNPTQALGLPERSVRAILAIGLTAAAVYQWVTGHPVDDTQKMLTTGAITYYFATRSAETAPQIHPVDLDALDLLRQARQEAAT